MQKTPDISCIITTYNRSNIVTEAVNSILAQTYKNWELIIVDDQSTDNTCNVIKGYEIKDNRIRCFKNKNKGANNARNLGIIKSHGKYIAFLDDDDVSYPQRFENQYKAMLKSGSRFIVSWFDIRDRDSGKIKNVNNQILKGAGVGFPSRWMIEKSLLDEVGGFNPRMVAMQEIELSYRLATRYTFDHHDDVVTTMYKTSNSTSTSERAIKGKIQLLEEVGELLHQSESAMWTFRIATGFYRAGELKKAKVYFKRAAVLDQGIFFKIAYCYFLCSKTIKISLLKKINQKLFNILSKHEYFDIVEHRIV